MTEEDACDGGATGTWSGYVEAYAFQSGSDHLRLTIDGYESATGATRGRATVGNGPPPPPATDADTGYPTDVMEIGPPYFYEGIEYTLVDATLEGSRLRATIQTRELWSDWCALQTPIPLDASDTVFGCLPPWSYSQTCGSRATDARRHRRSLSRRSSSANRSRSLRACSTSKAGTVRTRASCEQRSRSSEAGRRRTARAESRPTPVRPDR